MVLLSAVRLGCLLIIKLVFDSIKQDSLILSADGNLIVFDHFDCPVGMYA
jgi:hypothetical protein